MKLKFCLIFFTVTTILGAQLIHEPNSDIYKDIDRWAVQGYIKDFLPMIRPYPVPLIIKILDEVIENGDDDAAHRANIYKDKIAPDSRIFNPGILAFAQGENTDYGLLGAVFVEGVFRITELFTTSYHFGIYGMTDENGERFMPPGNYSPYADFISDTANIGPVELRPQWTSMTAIGISNIYFQAGLTRTSVGPFYDNSVIVGPQAPRAGHISFVITEPMWSYEMLMNIISASDDFGLGQFSNKYLMMHDITVRPFRNLEIGFIQTMLWGGRFEPIYLIPFSFLFASQSIFGFEDNSYMGLHFRWQPIDSLLFRGIVYIDDLHLNEMFKGTFRSKAAGQLGLSWAPGKNIMRGFLAKLDLDYTAVLPYMYTHWNEVSGSEAGRYNGYDGGDLIMYSLYGRYGRFPNYLNYTHLGQSLGSDLPPNSDRISLRTTWDLNQNIELRFNVYFSRHGNASASAVEAGLMDGNIHNGSILDDGCMDPWLFTDPLLKEYGKSRRVGYGFSYWLTQDVLDMRLGGTIGITLTSIPLPAGIIKIFVDYGIEYGWNRGTITNPSPIPGNNGFTHTWSVGGTWRLISFKRK
jgi:hypothetical protein